MGKPNGRANDRTTIVATYEKSVCVDVTLTQTFHGGYKADPRCLQNLTLKDNDGTQFRPHASRDQHREQVNATVAKRAKRSLTDAT